MGKPLHHAQSSVKKFGGLVSDYLPIHEKIDSSKGEIGDLRHRALTHHPFFFRECIIPLFGGKNGAVAGAIRNSSDKYVSIMDICEQHLLEDFSDHETTDGFIPVASDYLTEMEFQTWMNNGEGGETPPSQERRINWKNRKKIAISPDSFTINPFEEETFSRGCGGAGMMD